MESDYDSKRDTEKHIDTIRLFMDQVIFNLLLRAQNHDNSKLKSPEKEIFDKFTPKLRELTYGSSEYKSCLEQMNSALKHHYENNTHHPEYYFNGIDGMDLLDIIEMLVDWKSATLRHKDGNIINSLDINRVRFELSDQLYNILNNTVKRMNWE